MRCSPDDCGRGVAIRGGDAKTKLDWKGPRGLSRLLHHQILVAEHASDARVIDRRTTAVLSPLHATADFGRTSHVFGQRFASTTAWAIADRKAFFRETGKAFAVGLPHFPRGLTCEKSRCSRAS